jgi:hypothetical protein
MKVQKMVSLDPETAKIAESLPNFSRFVRIALSMHAMGEGVETERRRVRLWKRVSDAMRQECIRMRVLFARESEDLATVNVDDVFMTAQMEARKQSELDVE